jgi:hypothetical protein
MFNAYVFAAMGDCEMARSALDRVRQAADAFPLTSEATYALGRCGLDRQVVDAVARELTANRATFALAALHLGRGDRDRFFELLHQANAERSPQVLWVGVDPAFAGVRDDPRLGALLATIGLE